MGLARSLLCAVIISGLTSVFAAPAQSDPLPDWKPPKSEVVKEILAIGDSYTVGIGSNGNPDWFKESESCSRYKQSWPEQLQHSDQWEKLNGPDVKNPKLNFGACSGSLFKDVLELQLKQGIPRADTKYTAIGTPQLAVMIIGGNNLGFGKIVDACIIRGHGPASGVCKTLLQDAESTVRSPEFASELDGLVKAVIEAGRTAGGADPPESFSLYMGSYIQFWNDQDHGCDKTRWSYWGNWSPSKGEELTTTLRWRMNSIVNDLNLAIEKVAENYQYAGVHFVEGYQREYDGHRFCEPTDDDNERINPTTKKYWFWHHNSKGWDDGSEDTPIVTANATQNAAMKSLEVLVSDPKQREQIMSSDKPGDINPAFKDEETFYKAVQDNDELRPLADGDDLFRIFHPKGSGYEPMAKAFIADIFRDYSKPDNPEPPPPPPPAPPKYKPGQCYVHLDEYLNPCSREVLKATIEIHDADNRPIGHSRPKETIGLAQGYAMTSELPLVMDIKAVSDSKIEFAYGNLFFNSRMTKKDNPDAYCSHGGWDPRKANCEGWEPDWGTSGGGSPFDPAGDPGDFGSKAGIDCWFKCD